MFSNIDLSSSIFLNRFSTRTLATQSAMANPWLKNQGLLSAKDLWASYSSVAYENRLTRTRMLGDVGVGKRFPDCAKLYIFSS